jgi:glycerol-3-phosphate acyltransferase PlsY
MLTALLVVGAYLCGALPTGEWFAGRAGVDVRRAGSGNVGATNVARTAGARAGVLTLLCDVAKGFVPVLLASYALDEGWQVALVGCAAFAGHVYPVFVRFSGGKGVSTAFGVFLCLAPAAAATSLAVFLAVALGTRYVSLASLLAALTLAVASVAYGYGAPVWAAGWLVWAVVTVRHRQNIARLWRGQEPRFRIRPEP